MRSAKTWKTAEIAAQHQLILADSFSGRFTVNPGHRALENRRIGKQFGYSAGDGKAQWRMGGQQRFALSKNLAYALISIDA